MPAQTINAASALGADQDILTFNPEGPVAYVAVGAADQTFTGNIDLDIQYTDDPGQWYRLNRFAGTPGVASVDVPVNRQAQLRLRARTGFTGTNIRCVLR